VFVSGAGIVHVAESILLAAAAAACLPQLPPAVPNSASIQQLSSDRGAPADCAAAAASLTAMNATEQAAGPLSCESVRQGVSAPLSPHPCILQQLPIAGTGEAAFEVVP